MSTEAEQDEAERDEARAEVESLRDLPGRLCLPEEIEYERAEEQARLLLGIRLDRYKTIADAWRAKVAEVEAERDHERMVANEQLARAHDAVRERDEARAEVERLRALLARAYGYSTGAGDE